MSLPRFPDVSNDYTVDKSIVQILTSIAMEEIGLSHILNAEGEKMQYVLGTLEGARPPVSPTIEQVLDVNQSVKDMLQQVAFNQMFLNAKMSDALKAYLQNKKTEGEDGSGGDDGGTVSPPSDPDKKVTLAQPNSYTIINAGDTYEINSSNNIFDYESSAQSILTGEVTDENRLKLKGIKAGVAYIALGTSRGAIVMQAFQVRDPAKISGYVIKNGGKAYFTAAGQTRPCPVTVTPGTAQSEITWVSLNPAIVSVQPDGSLKSVQKGAADVIGTFTDTWGVQREITIHAGVGVQV